MLPSSLGRKAELSLLSVVSVPSRQSSFAAIFHSTANRKRQAFQNGRSSKLGHQDSYPDYFSRRRQDSVALWSRIKCLFKSQILNHQGRLSLPRWKGRKLSSSYLPTWVWLMPLPISVSIPSSLSTQLLNTEHDRVTTKNLAESSLFCGYLWTVALKFNRLPDMHGHYELLRSTSSENRDLKAGEVNLKRLGANLRFSSDSVAGPSLWARTSFGGDFILIAEFSENEGPKPVVSLPEIQLIRFKPPSFENKKLFLVY